MMKKNLMTIKILVPAIFLIAGTNFAFAKQSIKELTSKETNQSILKEIPKSTTAAPQAPKGELNRHSLAIGIGQTFLFGEFKQRGEDSITADFYYTYSASYSFDMFTNFHYSKHSFGNSYVTLPGLVAGIKARMFNFDSFSPYLLGGLGFYRPKVKRPIDGELVTSKSKLTFGFNFGGGVDLRLNEHYSVGLLAHYHNPFDVRQTVGTDIEGSYFKLMMMGSYTF